MKSFRELSTEVNEGSFPKANFVKGLETDIKNLESIIKRYSKDGFAVKMMAKGDFGDFTNEGKKVVEAAKEALAIINEQFLYTAAREDV
jgi:hypothetical protein